MERHDYYCEKEKQCLGHGNGGKVATILAIGTAHPTNCYYQTQYPDFFFRVTNSDHMTELKQKFRRICEKSKIKKRYLHMTEEILKSNSNIGKVNAPSLDTRQELMLTEVPKLGKEAALKAIAEWGQPISKITHLIFCTTSNNFMPGPDYHLTKLLGLSPSTKRFMLYQQGCFVTGTALRLAKDVAENNPYSRILVVSVDITTLYFHAPSETRVDLLVGQAIFSDGAGALIIGSNPNLTIEPTLFQIISASQSFITHTEDGVSGKMSEMGFTYYLSPKNPKYISENMEECLNIAFSNGICDFNSLFYIIQPGGPAILDQIEQKLGLKEEKLEASRHVLSEYGNMAGPTVVFVMDEMIKKSKKEGKVKTGEGLDYGVLVGIGPGITVETVVLKSMPIV